MKTISLSRGSFALVDDEDYGRISSHNWWCHSEGYAVRQQTIDGKRTIIYMERQILGLGPKRLDKRSVDHDNHNGLDNQKGNLRVCSHGQNCYNRSRYNKTGYKGVTAHASGFTAKIKFNKRLIRLGCHPTAELAHEMYCLAADMLHGEFANHYCKRIL